ncbi:MAG: hypothetical protein QXU97_03870 [Fervidicoccaceae archaeon]
MRFSMLAILARALAAYLAIGLIATICIYCAAKISPGLPKATLEPGFWITVLLWPLGLLAFFYGQ